MEFENLLTLIKTVSDSELTDFDYEENGTRIRLKKKKETVVVSGTSSNVPVMGLQTVQPLGQITESEAKMEKDIADGEPEGMLIKSPLVGTFMQHLPRTQIRLFLLEIRSKRSDACHRGSNETDERD